MRTILLWSAIALAAVTLSSVTGDEPNQPSSDRLTFLCSLSKGDMVLYPVVPGTTLTDSKGIIVTCDSLRLSSKGRAVLTNATIEMKDGRFDSKGEVVIDWDDGPSISVSSANGGGIREIQFTKMKPPAKPSK